ncbi:MAG: glycerol-3-phosphate responsive antiterminator [Bacillus sp. (in: firmicutes)]
MNQKVLPATTSMKDFEKFLESPFEKGVILETHIGQVKHYARMAKEADKKLFFHMDLINGLKNDEYGTQYLCQEFKPYGVISTKSSVIKQAKKNKVAAVQRIFMIDSHAIERSYRVIEKVEPDYIEVLPGAVPDMIREVSDRFKLPIFAGGLIRTVDEADQALEAGAISITTSKIKLWQYYANKMS